VARFQICEYFVYFSNNFIICIFSCQCVIWVQSVWISCPVSSKLYSIYYGWDGRCPFHECC